MWRQNASDLQYKCLPYSNGMICTKKDWYCTQIMDYIQKYPFHHRRHCWKWIKGCDNYYAEGYFNHLFIELSGNRMSYAHQNISEIQRNFEIQQIGAHMNETLKNYSSQELFRILDSCVIPLYNSKQQIHTFSIVKSFIELMSTLNKMQPSIDRESSKQKQILLAGMCTVLNTNDKIKCKK